MINQINDQTLAAINEFIQTGQAKLVNHDGVISLLFLDEYQYIPLDDLAYSSEFGLYQKSKFPDL